MRSATRSADRRGFGHLLLIVILVVAAGIGAIAYVVYNRQANNGNDSASTVHSQTAKNVDGETAPQINSSSDLDTTAKSLDQFDPNAASQSDSNSIDSQVTDL